MDCLEDKLDLLSEGCQKAIREYVEEVDEDPEIDEIFVRACAPFWEQHCQVCGKVPWGSTANCLGLYKVMELSVITA